MNDSGKPIVRVHILSGTTEEVNRNRENLRLVCEQIRSESSGRPVKITVHWGQSQQEPNR